jgi:outer membrane immunogenic protein
MPKVSFTGSPAHTESHNFIVSVVFPHYLRRGAAGNLIGNRSWQRETQMKRALLRYVGCVALLLAAHPSVAADIPTKAPAYMAPVAEPIFNWSGFYAGLQGGYGWGKSRHIDVGGGPALTDRFIIDGWFGGATLGYNWQLAAPWVLGVEGDFSFSGIKGAVHGLSGSFGCSNSIGCLTDIDWFGTARVRAGVVNDQSLLYLTGGIAYGKIFAYSNSQDFGTVNRTGWTAGAGWEQAFASNWSVKLEYLYVDLGEFEYDSDGPYRTDARFHVVRAGLNYRFASGKSPVPVVSRY